MPPKCRWFTREELPQLKLAEDTLDVIRKGFERLSSVVQLEVDLLPPYTCIPSSSHSASQEWQRHPLRWTGIGTRRNALR